MVGIINNWTDVKSLDPINNTRESFSEKIFRTNPLAKISTPPPYKILYKKIARNRDHRLVEPRAGSTNQIRLRGGPITIKRLLALLNGYLLRY